MLYDIFKSMIVIVLFFFNLFIIVLCILGYEEQTLTVVLIMIISLIVDCFILIFIFVEIYKPLEQGVPPIACYYMWLIVLSALCYIISSSYLGDGHYINLAFTLYYARVISLFLGLIVTIFCTALCLAAKDL